MKHSWITQLLSIALLFDRVVAIVFEDNSNGSHGDRITLDNFGIVGLVLMYTGVVPSVPVVNLALDSINIVDLNALSLPDANFSIDAMIGMKAKSVVFSNGQCETAAPLAYCGNYGQHFFTCPDLKLGANVTVSATAFSERYGAGNAISTRSVTILITRKTTTVNPPIVRVSNAPTKKPSMAPVHTPILIPVAAPLSPPSQSGVTGVRLMYTGVDPSVPVMNLKLDSINVIDLRLLSLEDARFSLEALIASDTKSVLFSNGQCETSPPLAYCGNYMNTFFTCPDLVLGANLTVTVSAHSERSGGGVIISTRALHIQIIRSTTNPKSIATKTPTKAPSRAPVLSPTFLQVSTVAPTTKKLTPPLATSTTAPVRKITNTPSKKPTKAPTKKPTLVPTRTPTKAQIPTPVQVPVTAPTQRCSIPRLTGEWGTTWTGDTIAYPIHVAEAQGTMIGNDFVITSGFKDGYISATPETYALDMFTAGAKWRRMDDMPFPIGLTHLGVAVKGTKAYFCGGYVGGALGTHNASCFQYDHSIPPGKGQWSSFAPIPDGGRSGGGMIYDSTVDALFYAAGSHRPNSGVNGAYDFHDTFMYSLKNPAAGWVRKTDIPYTGNHMNFVTAFDEHGKERHYFFGGQHGDHEETGNTDEMLEYNAVADQWIARQKIPYPLGHAAASARAIGCGFIVAGGRLNTGLTADIIYYDIPTNTWTKIGELPHQIHTNVCIIADGDLRCETGWATGEFSWTRPITI